LEVAVPDDTLVDFAVVAFREDNRWQVGSLPPRAAQEMAALVAAVRQQPTEGAALALCSYGDDFFLVVRPDGDEVRLLVSDVTAAGEWPIAKEALELLDEPAPEEDDLEHVAPAGDLEIFADLGVSSMELAAVCSDLELYPDEMLGQVAARIGFGPQFDRVVEEVT
jgi:putative tRNA adenosine deaminase-associated protein